MICISLLLQRRVAQDPEGDACPQCGHSIRWYENVPLLSWLALRGRCAQCQSAIPMRYPLVEALTAVRVPTDDIIDIIKGLDRNGKLHAQLIIE